MFQIVIRDKTGDGMKKEKRGIDERIDHFFSFVNRFITFFTLFR